jgi:hypothetical protein
MTTENQELIKEINKLTREKHTMVIEGRLGQRAQTQLENPYDEGESMGGGSTFESGNRARA